MAPPTLNYVADLEDEVALEGLDGITVQGLWLRLKHRPNFESNLELDEHSKVFLWSLICRNQEISMYELPTPRSELVIFNRYEHMDHELGIVLEPADTPPDIYPFHLIDDTSKGIRGSCATYHERIDITEKAATMTVEEVEAIYGRRLVLVASQLLRNTALCITACIDKFYDLTISQYVILERIGRSRRMGEITQGKVSLACMGESPKTMFYHRKRLLKLNLITKQPHQQKGVKGQTNNGSLLHLTRFYVERHSKFIMMIQRAVELLKSKPNHCAPFAQVKEEMGMPEPSCRKLFKSIEFQRFVRNVNKPYRTVYPDATPAQWKCKGKDAEKFVRMMELINPTVDPLEMCKVDEVVEEEEEEEDMYPGILDQTKILWREDLLHQAYKIVEDAGPDGVAQSDMARLLGQSKLDSRTICRNLQRCNTVHSLMKDVGRQRVSRYVSHKFMQTGHLTQEFRKERQKMMAMLEHDKPHGVGLPTGAEKSEVSKTVESNRLEGVEVNMEVVMLKKKAGKENRDSAASTQSSTSASSSSSSSATLSQAKQGDKKPPEGKVHSEGFLSLLNEMKMMYSSPKHLSPHVTTRMMKRANLIIEAVRTARVIDDAFKLQKMIVQAETKEGYTVKMDKKSLDRILDKLAREGFLKNIIVKLRSKTTKNVKLVRYVVHPSITFDNHQLISTIEQQKLKFLVASNDPKKDGEGSGADRKAAAIRTVKTEDKSEGVLACDAGKRKEAEGEVMNRSSVGESMHQIKLMNHTNPNICAYTDNSSSQGNEDSSSLATGDASPTTHKKPMSTKASLGPKFVRMCELHKLLFYLVYGYEGSDNVCQEDAWVTIATTSPEVNLQNEDMSEYPNIYCPKLSWKMFIPPLPRHMNTDTGWAFVCDVLLRLPLCIFVRLVSVSCVSEELQSFLAHPLKKNLLVKYLPPHLRQTLLQGRRYVSYVIDLINRLCYMGLLQYGQQVMKEKDQVFIYVNRRASLIDSTTSSPGYHQISADKEYVRKEYHFTHLQDIIQYWYDLWTIAMHTPLGGHNCMQGKKITIQILERKPQIMETLLPRSTWDAPARDVGDIPGDGRGAGGLDSAMFAHLKRNWSSSTFSQQSVSRPSAILPPSSMTGERSSYEGSASYSQYLMSTTNSAVDTLSPKHRLAGLRNVKLSIYRPRLGPDGKGLKVPVGLVSRQPRGRKRRQEDVMPAADTMAAAAKYAKSYSTSRNNPTSYQREMKQRKKSPKKPYYDEEDRAALRRMNKLRVDWSSGEDSFLLLCKVASCFLFPNVRTKMINFSLVRDVLHERFPEARNKTSRACQRRINYIMKNATTEDNVSIFLEEVRQDASIVADFKSPKLPRNKDNLENVYSKIFRDLMNRLVIKFASSHSRHCPDLPDTLEEFEDRYKVIMASSSLRNKLKIKAVTSISDIDFYVVNALIYSSLCSKFDRDSYAYQLYLAYQQYPHTLLNAVLTRMRQDQMISYKKAYNRSSVAQTCLPLSTSPFQLSCTYQYVFNFKYQYEIFGQAWHMLKQFLLQSQQSAMRGGTNDRASAPSSSSGLGDGTEGSSADAQEDGVPVMIHHEGGFCAAIVALMATKRLIFNTIIPEQIIMMDHKQHTLLQDQHQSLLQRFSDHTQMSGRDVEDFNAPFTDSEKQQQQPSQAVAKSKTIDAAKERGEDVDKSDASPLSSTIPLQDSEEQSGITASLRSVKRKAGMERDRAKKLCKTSTITGHEEESMGEEATREEEGEEMEQDEETFACHVHANVGLTSTPQQPSMKQQQAQATQSCVEAAAKGKPRRGKEKKKKTKCVSFQDKETVDAVDMQDTENTSVQVEALCAEEDVTAAEPQGRSSVPSASRLGLYMMRDQLTLADVNQINIQHAQEHLVVNACEVTCRLRPPPDRHDEYVAALTDDFEAAEDILLPLSKDAVVNALEKRRKVTLQSWNQLEQVMAEWEEQGQSPDLMAMVRDVYEYIDQQKELGTSVKDLKARYRDAPYNITAVVALMEGTLLLLLRVGADVVRWVTMQHTKPWLIQTNKITRMNRQTLPVQGVYKMNLENTGEADDTTDNDVVVVSEQVYNSQEQNKAVSQKSLHASISSVPDTSQEQECSARATSQHDLETESQGEEMPSGTDVNVPPHEAQPASTEEPLNPAPLPGCSIITSTSTIPVLVSDEGKEEVAPIHITSSTSKGEPTATAATKRSRRLLQSADANKQGMQESDGGLEVRHIHSFIAMRKKNYTRDENISTRMEKSIRQHQQMSEHERIDIAVRPWVRLNGTLNRRVLDRLLGAVLCMVMERPGVSGRDIMCRFSPALQPAHTYDLLETLVQLQCVVRVQLVHSHKPSLFSDVVDYSLVLAEVNDCDDDVLYEPSVDAILKLAMFIGDKKYAQDFLSGERR